MQCAMGVLETCSLTTRLQAPLLVDKSHFMKREHRLVLARPFWGVLLTHFIWSNG
jgi:hypothetical protein